MPSVGTITQTKLYQLVDPPTSENHSLKLMTSQGLATSFSFSWERCSWSITLFTGICVKELRTRNRRLLGLTRDWIQWNNCPETLQPRITTLGCLCVKCFQEHKLLYQQGSVSTRNAAPVYCLPASAQVKVTSIQRTCGGFGVTKSIWGNLSMGLLRKEEACEEHS
jgi:hypothetical protein